MDKQLYKDGIKHDTETITYPENWQDIDMFLSKQLEEFKKSNMNEEYYKKQNEYIINCFTNFSKARFERMINQEWENEKSKTKVPDENSFKKEWKDKMIKYSGVIEKISRDSYGDGLWYVTISGMKCELLSPKYVKKYDCYVKRYDTESPYYFRVDERNKSYKMTRYLSNNNLVSEELLNSSLKKIAEDKLLDHRR
ncbi:MAG: hypothetical protein K5675_07690, partial [Lachnospiraceae bacterium]|nr:hypothetical protein [Lachnospiraceae bacterium]